MSLNRNNAKRDANEKPIVDALQAAGYWVVRLDQPVDLLVGRKGYPHFALLEVKVMGKDLNDNQLRFFQQSEGACRFVVYTPEQAVSVCDTWIKLTYEEMQA
jgi:hypothetical protein